MRILLDDSPGDAGGTPGGPSTEPKTATTPSAPASPAVAEPPKTAATVNAGTENEETEKLRAELEQQKALTKQREQENASITDEFKRFKDATEARRDVPVTKGKVKPDPAPRRFLRR